MSARLTILALLLAAVFALPSVAAAAAYPDNVTVTQMGAASTASNSIAAGSSYHVHAWGLRRNAVTVIDTTGPSCDGCAPFFSRQEYKSDGQGNVNYNAVAGSYPGQYGITVQQMNGGNLRVVDFHAFDVQ